MKKNYVRTTFLMLLGLAPLISNAAGIEQPVPLIWLNGLAVGLGFASLITQWPKNATSNNYGSN